MPGDSKLWCEAYAAMEMHKVNTPAARFTAVSKTHGVPGFKEAKHPQATWADDRLRQYQDLVGELQTLNIQLKKLKLRKSEVQQELKRIAGGKPLRSRSGQVSSRQLFLYALRLQDNCWYVGMSPDVERRFKKHCKGKGAIWTVKHKPIEVAEVRPTGKPTQAEVALLEDDMTIEYALKYGSDFVRGGGFCQTKPGWPTIILQNEQGR
jgi:predicted GIY-YIG superfamily endonuclease